MIKEKFRRTRQVTKMKQVCSSKNKRKKKKKEDETSLRNRTGLSIIRAQASEMAKWACSLVCYERVITKTDKQLKLSVCSLNLNKRNLFPPTSGSD